MTQRITYIYRRTTVFFSIENIFHRVSKAIGMQDGVHAEEVVLPYSGFNPWVVWRNILFAGRLKADVFHVTGDVHYINLCLPSRKTVLTVHDCVFMYQTAGFKRWLLQQLLLKWPLRRCAWATTVSEQTKRDILRFSDCPAEKIFVIPNPVNDKITYHVRPFREDQPVILFIGTTPNKNLERVIAALKGISCILDIIGHLPSGIEKLLAGNNIMYRNSFNLSEDAICEKYTEADMVLFPSTFEGFGMPIIEAQKAGRPLITSDLSPMKEVAGAGALLVDPFDSGAIREAVLKMKEDGECREDLVRKGLLNSQRFDIATIASQYAEVYKKITTKGDVRNSRDHSVQ